MAASIIAFPCSIDRASCDSWGVLDEETLRAFAELEDTEEHRRIAALSDEEFEAECLAQMGAEAARQLAEEENSPEYKRIAALSDEEFEAECLAQMGALVLQ